MTAATTRRGAAPFPVRPEGALLDPRPTPKSSAALDVERLGPADLGAMRALHGRVLDSLPAPDLLKPEPEAFHRLVLEEGAGVAFGVRRPDDPTRLMAYGIVLFRLMPEDCTARALGVPPGERLCKVAGSSVDPDARGWGLQRVLLAHRLALAARNGFDHAYGTVAPGNWISWRNLVRTGFRLDSLEIRYGHLLRFVAYRPKRARLPAPEEAEAWADYEDLERIGALMAEGRVGGVCVLEGGRPQIGFVPRAATVLTPAIG